MAKTLEQIRTEAGKSRAQAAQALGITESAYWRKEHGERGLKSDEMVKLAELFGVPVQDIVLSDRSCADSAQTATPHRPVIWDEAEGCAKHWDPDTGQYRRKDEAAAQMT